MREYTIQIGGMDHTVLLSDEDAKNRGLSASPDVKQQATDAKQAPEPPKNKARAASSK